MDTPRLPAQTWLELRYAPTGMWIQQLPIAVDASSNNAQAVQR